MSCFAEHLRKFAGDEKFYKLLDSLPRIEAGDKLRYWQETLLKNFEKETGIAVPQPLAIFIKEMIDYDLAQEEALRDAFAGVNRVKISAAVSDFDKVIGFLLNNGNKVLGKRWQGDKEGFHTMLAEPIDFSLLYRNFEFSEDISVSRRHQYIQTKREWLEIRYSEDMAKMKNQPLHCAKCGRPISIPGHCVFCGIKRNT